MNDSVWHHPFAHRICFDQKKFSALKFFYNSCIHREQLMPPERPFICQNITNRQLSQTVVCCNSGSFCNDFEVQTKKKFLISGKFINECSVCRRTARCLSLLRCLHSAVFAVVVRNVHFVFLFRTLWWKKMKKRIQQYKYKCCFFLQSAFSIVRRKRRRLCLIAALDGLSHSFAASFEGSLRWSKTSQNPPSHRKCCV